MKSNTLKTLGGALVALSVAAAAGPADAQELPRANLKVIGPWSSSATWTLVVEPFFNDKVPELSNGQITADLTSMTEMGLKGPEIFRLVKVGITDLATTVTGYAAGEVPELGGLDLAGVSLDAETMRKVADAYAPAINEIMQDRVGVRQIVWWPASGQGVWCAVPIGGIGDLRGKKVRVSSPTLSDFMAAVGASPVTMAYSEVVPAMQRGVIDCAVTGTISGNISKWPEVATHLYPIILGWSMWMEVANERNWQRLDPAVRDFVATESKDTLAAHAWDIAQVSTNQGIWCTTGDPKCTWGAEHEVTRYDQTLVPITDEDRARIAEIVEQSVLPSFAESCGTECVEMWNETVGEVVNMTAKAP